MSDQRKPRILCVSRSTSHLKLIISHLSQEEFEAVAASSPEEAVAFCTANHVNAIVLDSEFATEGGWTVARSFRMVAPQLPIVLVKANHNHEMPVGIDAVAAGADLVIGTLKMLLANATRTHNGASPLPKLPFVRHFKADATVNKIPEDDGKPSGS
jgi:CheY-like chemotaxis protein